MFGVCTAGSAGPLAPLTVVIEGRLYASFHRPNRADHAHGQYCRCVIDELRKDDLADANGSRIHGCCSAGGGASSHEVPPDLVLLATAQSEVPVCIGISWACAHTQWTCGVGLSVQVDAEDSQCATEHLPSALWDVVALPC